VCVCHIGATAGASSSKALVRGVARVRCVRIGVAEPSRKFWAPGRVYGFTCKVPYNKKNRTLRSPILPYLQGTFATSARCHSISHERSGLAAWPVAVSEVLGQLGRCPWILLAFPVGSGDECLGGSEEP
jgi:hypothetical protein